MNSDIESLKVPSLKVPKIVKKITFWLPAALPIIIAILIVFGGLMYFDIISISFDTTELKSNIVPYSVRAKGDWKYYNDMEDSNSAMFSADNGETKSIIILSYQENSENAKLMSQDERFNSVYAGLSSFMTNVQELDSTDKISGYPTKQYAGVETADYPQTAVATISLTGDGMLTIIEYPKSNVTISQKEINKAAKSIISIKQE